MISVLTYTVGATPTLVFNGAPEAPPPNRLMGRSSILVRVRSGGSVYVGGENVSPTTGVMLTVGGALALSPVGPTDQVYAVAASADVVVEVLEQGMYV